MKILFFLKNYKLVLLFFKKSQIKISIFLLFKINKYSQFIFSSSSLWFKFNSLFIGPKSVISLEFILLLTLLFELS